MKVKIGDRIYDPNFEALLFILSEQDKKNISAMAPEATMYCCFPSSWSAEDAKKFMSVEPNFKTVSDVD